MNIRKIIEDSAKLKLELLNNEALIKLIEDAVSKTVACYQQGGKTMFCGNGGSAADAQHLAAELSGRFYFDRKPLDAEALHVNTSYLTAVANDYSYEEVYARLVEARGLPGDIVFAFSTSGNSSNIVKALETAQNKKMITIGFTGSKPGRMDPHCDLIFKMPSGDTPRVQELHILLGHIICQGIEEKLFGHSTN